jgi:uncharacterized cupin superfamily protein
MKKTLADIPPRTGTIYPPPFDRVTAGRAKFALGDAFGLSQFGVNFTELAPGAASALRHWHSDEDEFVYVLDGELVLIDESGEEVLRPGDFVGFKAGVANGHHFVNRSDRPARYLEVGTRATDRDHVSYPDDDFAIHPVDGKRVLFRKDGSRC